MSSILPAQIDAAKEPTKLAGQELDIVAQEMAQLGIEQQKYLKTPIGSLPAEILSYIFSFFCQSPNNRGSYWDQERPEWVITKVCSHWRAVASATPSLWHEVIVRVESGLSPASVENRINLLHLYLERSDPLPLSFTLNLRWDLDQHKLWTQLIFEALRPHAGRLRLLSLYTVPLSITNLSSIFPFGSCLARLEEVKLYLKAEESEVFDMFQNATLLRKVVFIGLSSLRQVPFPVEAIRTLDLTLHGNTDTAISDVLRLLHRCRNTLMEFNLKYHLAEENELDIGDLPIILPYLEELRLGGKSQAGANQLLDNLLTPNLRHFEDTSTSVAETASCSNITSLIVRSRCLLGSLRLACTSPTDDSRYELRRQCRHLQVLRLNQGGMRGPGMILFDAIQMQRKRQGRSG